MRDIGILPIKNYDVFCNINLKRELLYFEKLVLTKSNDLKFYSEFAEKNPSIREFVLSKLSDIEYLLNRDLIVYKEYDLEKLKEIPHPDSGVCQPCKMLKDLIFITLGSDKYVDSSDENDKLKKLEELETRILATYMEYVEGERPLIINDSVKSYKFDSFDKQTEVLEFIINKFPTPDLENISWEKIIDFRSDSETHQKYIDFKNWLTELATSQKNKREVEEAIQYKILEYTNYLKRHKFLIKYQIFSTVAVTTGYIYQGVSNNTLPYVNILGGLLLIGNHIITNNIIEAFAPGKEIAYLVKAQKELTTTNK
jgi:hypothetical protein